jgi:hypothetical protein
VDRADAGDIPPPGAACPAPLDLVDTSSPTAVVGTGTPESCTETALRTALGTGGVITFSCGTGAHTIAVTSELRIDGWEGPDVVLDGGDLVTLDGGGTTRILGIHSSYERDRPLVTLQRLKFTGGNSGTDGSQTENGGGAVFRLGGRLQIIGSTFTDNRCPESGQDVAGGAVSSIGEHPTVIVGSVFQGNRCSNGGAIGNLGNPFTLVNSSVVENQATGSGGNPGNGGNGGGISVDGQGKTVTICGATLARNQGKAYGGGLFRVSYEGEPTNLSRVLVEGNSIPDNEQSMAGGLYLQGTTIDLSDTTLAGNSARAAGGMFVGPGSVLRLTNVTVAGNLATTSLGGGLAISDGVTGLFLNVTIAGNRAPGEVAFAGAISGGGTGITMTNTVVAGNEAGNGWNPISCTGRFTDGGGNFQWPVVRAGGGTDDPDSLCTAGASVVDPLLGALGDHGGPTPTILPLTGSPVIGAGAGCPETDQRGETRPTACASGASEP